MPGAVEAVAGRGGREPKRCRPPPNCLNCWAHAVIAPSAAARSMHASPVLRWITWSIRSTESRSGAGPDATDLRPRVTGAGCSVLIWCIRHLQRGQCPPSHNRHIRYQLPDGDVY